MSKELLSKVAKEMLQYLDLNEKFRNEYLKIPGQLFAFERLKFLTFTRNLYKSFGLSKEEASKFSIEIADRAEASLKRLHAREIARSNKVLGKTLATERRKDAEAYVNRKKEAGNLGSYTIYWITNYDQIKGLKTRLSTVFASKLPKAKRKDAKKAFSFTGLHVGHGANVGFSAAEGRAAASFDAANTFLNQENVVSEFGEREIGKAEFDLASIRREVESIFNTKIDLFSTKVIGSDGTWKVSFVPILTLQKGGANLKDAKIEYAAIQKLKEYVRGWEEGEVLGFAGSRSIKDATEAVILEPFSQISKKQKRIKNKFNTKPTRLVKEKNHKGSASKKEKVKQSVSIASGNLLRDPRTGRFVSKKTAASPINLLAILNAKLPEYVARNMIFPALRYRTGRFANSVRAIDVQQTNKGFPSIGYTYQKYPYQTFEPGFAQGTPERDPRTLIDKSIREIATEVQLGRFFTRRI